MESDWLELIFGLIGNALNMEIQVEIESDNVP